MNSLDDIRFERVRFRGGHFQYDHSVDVHSDAGGGDFHLELVSLRRKRDSADG